MKIEMSDGLPIVSVSLTYMGKSNPRKSPTKTAEDK